jgi:lipopolysaccharide biosynthesis protein
MGHGNFDSALWGTTDHRAMDFVIDVAHRKVQHLQTHSIGFDRPST